MTSSTKENTTQITLWVDHFKENLNYLPVFFNDLLHISSINKIYIFLFFRHKVETPIRIMVITDHIQCITNFLLKTAKPASLQRTATVQIVISGSKSWLHAAIEILVGFPLFSSGAKMRLFMKESPCMKTTESSFLQEEQFL